MSRPPVKQHLQRSQVESVVYPDVAKIATRRHLNITNHQILISKMGSGVGDREREGGGGAGPPSAVA